MVRYSVSAQRTPSYTLREKALRVPERIRQVEEIIPCQEEDCQCAECGSAKSTLGYETAEKLDFIPAEFIVRVI